jgi:hypothetical protein
MVAIVCPTFQLGETVATPGALEALMLAGQSPTEFVDRHVRGDWGDLSKDDREANEQALIDDDRLFSAYHTRKGTKLWVITEADRSVTTILLPDDY